MNKEQVQELMMGAAVVALAYALYKHFKPGAAKEAPATAQPSGGAAFAYGAPSQFTTLMDMLSGTVHDIGSFDGQNSLATIEAGPVVAGNGPRAPGALW